MNISVKVKFERSKEKVLENNGTYVVFTKKEPKQGEANEDVVKEIARYFKIDKKRVKIIKGSKLNKKIISIND